MKPFDRNSLDEQIALVARYVAGDLSRSERAEFETWLIVSPVLAAEVDLERKLRRGMHSAARRGWLPRDSRERPSSRRWQIAAAASLMAATIVGAVFTVPDHAMLMTASQQETTAPRAATARVFRLGVMRGLGDAPDVTMLHSDVPDHLVMIPDVVLLTCADGSIDIECAGGALPSVPQYAEYQLDIVGRRTADPVWRSSPQAPAGTALTFTFQQARNLGPGDYDLLVRGRSIDHEEVVARFLLRILPND